MWMGPVPSGFGVHLVYVGKRIDARLPALEEIRDKVASEWSAQRCRESNEAIYRKWREGYKVTIEAQALQPEPGPGGVASR